MLEVKDLKVSFRSEQGLMRAIDGVSFNVGEGEILGMVGESGSGKTVSLLAVMGLINDPNAVIEGSIKFKGRELVGMPNAEMRKLRGREIAMIFQDPMTALTPVYTIGWQIAEQILAHEKISKSAARQKAIDLLAEVNIPNPADAIDRYPHQLSGGMRQRAVIAMALSCNPSLLVADEPTTALDVTVQAQILDLVRKLQRNHKSAVVFITHDMGVIAEIADRVMVMYGGRIVERGQRNELFLKPKRLRAISGSPPSLLNRPQGCCFGPRCVFRFEACSVQPDLGKSGHAAACFLKGAQ